MKAIIIVCLVAAGAAFSEAVLCTNKEKPSCVPILKDGGPQAAPTPNDCPVCEVRAIAESCLNPLTWVPICDGNDFFPLQYDENKGETFCVFKDGKECPSSRRRGRFSDPLYCSQFCQVLGPAPEPQPCTARKAMDQTANAWMTCSADGYFAPEQSKDVYKWCVNPDGQAVPGTFTNHANGETPADCQGYRALRFKCPADGFYTYAGDCTRYITCSGTEAYLCQCPCGQAWDDQSKVCNWEDKVPSCSPNVAAYYGK